MTECLTWNNKLYLIVNVCCDYDVTELKLCFWYNYGMVSYAEYIMCEREIQCVPSFIFSTK